MYISIPTFKCCKITKVIRENNVQTNWKKEKVRLKVLNPDQSPKLYSKKNTEMVHRKATGNQHQPVKHSTDFTQSISWQ